MGGEWGDLELGGGWWVRNGGVVGIVWGVGIWEGPLS
jgi:hypothetical protein